MTALPDILGGLSPGDLATVNEASEHRPAGSCVVTLGTFAGTPRLGGPELKAPLCFVTRFENGMPVRTEEYLDPRRALAAAGLD